MRDKLKGRLQPRLAWVVQSGVKIAKFEISYESVKGEFSLLLLVNNLMTGRSKKEWRKLSDKMRLNKKKKHGLKFNPGLALISLRTTGHRRVLPPGGGDSHIWAI